MRESTKEKKLILANIMESMRRDRCHEIRNSRCSCKVKRKLWGKGKKKSKVIHLKLIPPGADLPLDELRATTKEKISSF
jgi:hypothetical protein